MYESLSFIIIFVMHISLSLPKKILAWYDNNKRKLPWRVSKKSPKKVYYRLLSEFMLQQTQVKTVIPYFNNFTQKFRTLKSLSKSNDKSNYAKSKKISEEISKITGVKLQKLYKFFFFMLY